MAVIKHCDQGSLQKKGFVWAVITGGLRVQPGGKAQQQAADMPPEQEAESSCP